MILWAELAALGAFVGLLSTFIGLGGGVIMVPALVGLGLNQQESIATSLMTIFLIAVFNVRAFARRGLIPWKVVTYLVTASGITAFVAARISVYSQEWILKAIFAIALVSVFGLTLWLGKSKADGAAVLNRWAYFGLGIFTGALSGITGLGGGVAAGPLLIRLRMAEGAQIVPIINVMLLFTSALGVAGYVLNQPPQWIFAFVLFVSAQFTTPIGYRYQHSISERLRFRILLGVLLLVLGHVCWDLYVHGG